MRNIVLFYDFISFISGIGCLFLIILYFHKYRYQFIRHYLYYYLNVYFNQLCNMIILFGFILYFHEPSEPSRQFLKTWDLVFRFISLALYFQTIPRLAHTIAREALSGVPKYICAGLSLLSLAMIPLMALSAYMRWNHLTVGQAAFQTLYVFFFILFIYGVAVVVRSWRKIPTGQLKKLIFQGSMIVIIFSLFSIADTALPFFIQVNTNIWFVSHFFSISTFLLVFNIFNIYGLTRFVFFGDLLKTELLRYNLSGWKLTAREKEILLLLKKGLSSKEIAAGLDISIRTADNHTAAVFRKIGVNSRLELSKKMEELGGLEV